MGKCRHIMVSAILALLFISVTRAQSNNPAEKYNFYFGSLHGHTNASWPDARGYSPTDAYSLAKQEGLDFFAVTDHDIYMDGTSKPANWLNSKSWTETAVAAKAAVVESEFIAIRGFEWSNFIYGHMCVFDTENYTDFLATPFAPVFTSLRESMYSWVKENSAIAQFSHPGSPANMFNNLALDKAVVDNYALIETANKDIGNYTGQFIPGYIKALDNGWKVAPTANQDNHVLHINSHRTVILARELTQAALFEAIKARRVYSTDDPDMKVTFMAGEQWMGSTVAAPDGYVPLTIIIEDNEPLLKIEIISNGGKIVAQHEFSNGETNTISTIRVPCASGQYFFLKVTEKDTANSEYNKRTFDETDTANGTQVAVTAPIWINNK